MRTCWLRLLPVSVVMGGYITLYGEEKYEGCQEV